MRIRALLILCLSIAFSNSAHAASDSDALATCFADNTSGKDRKELARWIFLALTAHPEIRDLSSAGEEARTQSNKFVAVLVMRLLTESCVTEVRAVYAKGGSATLSDAFKSLGELAMQELMTNKNVSASITGYLQYIDKKKLEDALRAK
jgi:hypothetical protein